MKLILLIIVIVIQSVIQLSYGQRFNYGSIMNNQNLCLTTDPKLNYKFTFAPCGTSEYDNLVQTFYFNIGSTTKPTFEAYYLKTCLYLSGDNLSVLGISSLMEIYNRNKWSVKNTGDNGFHLINNHARKCLTSNGNSRAITVSTCDGSSSQTFKFVYKNNEADTVTYNVDSIPTIKGKVLDLEAKEGPSGSYQGLNYAVGEYSLKFEDCMLRVYNPSNELLWSSDESKPSYCSKSATLKIQPDNRLCIYPHESNAIAHDGRLWCSLSADTGARFVTFMPPYSYGREFGVLLLNSKKQMVWGKFGKSVIPDASYILIPGNFIDKLNPTKSTLSPKQFITNGRDYLRFSVNNDGRLRLSRGFVTAVKLHWITKLPTIKGPYRFAFGSDSNFCIKNNITEAGIYCTMTHSTTSRYIQVPLLDPFDASYWGWVVQDESNKLTYGAFNIPTETHEFSKYGEIVTKSVFSKTLSARIEDDGRFNVSIPSIGYSTRPTLQGQVMNRDTHPCPNDWMYAGYWNSDGSFALKNMCLIIGIMQDYHVFKYSKLRSPITSPNRFVAGTGFPELFIINGDGIMGYNMPF